MSLEKSDLVVVGAILGAHGVRGDVRVKSFTAVPEDLFAYGPLLDEAGQPLLDPVSARPAKTHFVVTPATKRQKEDWDALKSTRLHIPRAALPAPDEDEFYIDDLVGLDVFTGGDAPMGRIKAVVNHGASDLIEIQPKGAGKIVIVPFTLEDVPIIDLENGRIVVAHFEIWADESRPEET